MKTALRSQWPVPALRIALGGIFLAASISKIIDLDGFVTTVVGYGLLPRLLAEAYGWAMPWIELCLGCSLVLGILPRLAAAISLPVTISFAVASSYALVKSPGGVCGCFGSFFALSHPAALTIDGVMLVLAAAVLIIKRPEFLSAGQLIDRINPRLRLEAKAFYRSAMLGVLALGMGAVTLVSFAVQTAVAPGGASLQARQVKIPPPFAETVEASLVQSKPVLIFVYFQGCYSCEESEPIVRRLADEFAATVTYLPIDYDKYTQQVLDMGVTGTPTVHVIAGADAGGSFKSTFGVLGTVEEAALRAALQKAVASQ